MRKHLLLSLIGISIFLLLLSCAKPKRTNPYDPGNPYLGILAGRVTDAGGAPIIGARVTTTPVSAPSDASTDNSGNYQLVGLTPGSYQAIITATSYDTVRNDATITAGQTTTLNAQMVFNGGGPTKGWIEGVVLKTDTTAIENAMVVASRAGFADSVKSNITGFYRIPGLLPDIYRVAVRGAPPPPVDSTYVLPVVQDTIPVSANQRTLLNFTLFRWVWWNFNNDTTGRQAQGWTSGRGIWQVRDTIGQRAYLGRDTSSTGQGAFSTPTVGRKCNAFNLTLSFMIPQWSPPPKSKVEVLFHTQTGLSHYLAEVVDSGPPGTPSNLRLYRVVNNAPTLLGSHGLGVLPRDMWHSIQVGYVNRAIELKVNGTTYIQLNDGTYPVGGIGIGVAGVTGAAAYFDDLSLVY